MFSDSIVVVYTKGLTDHVDIVARHANEHVNQTVHPDSPRLWQFERLDACVVQDRE